MIFFFLDIYRLNNGIEMFRYGFGVYKLMDEVCMCIVLEIVVDVGYCLFDMVLFYYNEKEFGDFFVLSGLKRDEFFVIIKMWNIE